MTDYLEHTDLAYTGFVLVCGFGLVAWAYFDMNRADHQIDAALEAATEVVNYGQDTDD